MVDVRNESSMMSRNGQKHEMHIWFNYSILDL